MSDPVHDILSAAGTPLIAERGARFAFDAYVVAVVWLAGTAAFACGDGVVRFVDSADAADGPATSIRAHEGAILSAVADVDGRALISGGDDGRLLRTSPSGRSEELAAFGPRWVEHLASSAASGVVACAAGKEACVLPRGGGLGHAFAHPSTVGGLALDDKGRRLAVSHYGGVTVWWALAPQAQSRQLPWRGSHLGVTWSPDGAFLVTAMQENALHGWRLGDAASMHMAGYPSKPRSLAWAQKGRWLVTAGADRVVCWPFLGKSGPMNKSALELGPGGLLVTRVASHPSEDAIAAGYEDGSVLLLRLADDKSVVVQAAGHGAVSALAWSADGAFLAIGSEDGGAGVVALGRRQPG